MLRLAAVDEGPIAERAAGMVVPEAPLCWPAPMIAVEPAREGLARTQMHHARHGRIAAVAHGEPVPAARHLFPTLLHHLEVAGPGEGIARQRRLGACGQAGVLLDV